MAKIMTDSKHYTDIANAIREKTGSTDLMRPTEMSEYIRGIQGGGGEDIWQYVTTLNQTFQYVAFPDGYELTVNVPKLTTDRDIGNIITGATGLRKVTLKCGRDDVILRSYFAFASCQTVEEIDLSEFCSTEVVRITKPDYLFYGALKLKTVHGVLDFSQCTAIGTPFSGANQIVNITIAPNSINVDFNIATCIYLSDATIQSIIDGLADLTGQTAQTLTFHAIVGAKLTDAQRATIAAKNWILKY